MRRIERGSPRSADAGVRTPEVLMPDESGEVTARFQRLFPGYSYGLQWTDD